MSMSEGTSFERTIWVKGQRERSIQKLGIEDNEAARFMPEITTIRQCDLRQTIKLNEKEKKYFLEPFTENIESVAKPLPPVKPSTRTEVIKGGTVTFTYTLTDTGERKTLFGLPARHLIIKQSTESSKDSCGGESKSTMVEDAWFVWLMPETARCDIEIPRRNLPESRGCKDRIIMNGVFRNPGFLLNGTMEMFDAQGKSTGKFTYETLELSKSILDISLFEVPIGFTQVDTEQALMKMPSISDLMEMGKEDRRPKPAGVKARKMVGIDFFTGATAKINQEAARRFIAEKLGANGLEGALVISQTNLLSGIYSNVIGVEVRSVKESGASKIGGLFGKVTGDPSAAKLGKSEAEIALTVYEKDGKTVVATGTAKEKVDGKADDAVKAAIDSALMQVISKLK